jgi:hypothetical protein
MLMNKKKGTAIMTPPTYRQVLTTGKLNWLLFVRDRYSKLQDMFRKNFSHPGIAICLMSDLPGTRVLILNRLILI